MSDDGSISTALAEVSRRHPSVECRTVAPILVQGWDHFEAGMMGRRCISCEEVGFVSRVNLLSGEVRSVTAALKVVEEVQEEVQEIEDE